MGPERVPRQQSFVFTEPAGGGLEDEPAGSLAPAPAPDAFPAAQHGGQLSLFGAPPAGGPAPAPETTDHLAGCSTLDELRSAALSCTLCRLRAGCTQVVFGEGSQNAAVMFVGEGPGETEDQLGRPFVGRAGQLLDKILVASGFSREEVYIGNVVKCRPPDNRLPSPDEAEACLPWLRAQIRLIKPRVVVCLGAAASQVLIDARLRITTARGKWFERNGLRLIPTFHPAALLRDMSKKLPVWEDMKKIRAEIDKQRNR